MANHPGIAGSEIHTSTLVDNLGKSGSVVISHAVTPLVCNQAVTNLGGTAYLWNRVANMVSLHGGIDVYLLPSTTFSLVLVKIKLPVARTAAFEESSVYTYIYNSLAHGEVYDPGLTAVGTGVGAGQFEATDEMHITVRFATPVTVSDGTPKIRIGFSAMYEVDPTLH